MMPPSPFTFVATPMRDVHNP